MKLNESQVAQRTGYKNSSTSVDILDWVCISFFLLFLLVTFVRLPSKWLQIKGKKLVSECCLRFVVSDLDSASISHTSSS